jgi:class 3 adenylate cyclase
MPIKFDELTLTEIIQLQNSLSVHLAQRYEQHLAVAFSDIIGSTAYFNRFGNEAGHRIQQQHFDILSEILVGSNGRIVDTAGDGIFMVFSQVETAVSCLVKFHRTQSQTQASILPERRWASRVAIHWGQVLTDGRIVIGDAVNLCAKLGSTRRTQEILVTKSALSELPKRYALMCHPTDAVTVLDKKEPVEVYQVSWKDRKEMPTHILIQETGERIAIPDQPLVTCGRLQAHEGSPANDIVLNLPDTQLTRRISRWHLELRQEFDQLLLCAVSDQPTVVDGNPLRKGDRIRIRCGSTARISEVMTLKFEMFPLSENEKDLTLPHEANQ